MFSKEIVEYKEKLDNMLNDIKKRIAILKNYYAKIAFRDVTPLAIIGLDSLTSQRIMIESQYQHMQKYRLLIINKMYCENYKIHKIFIKEYNIVSLFPPYKDLEQYKEYDFNHILAMNKNIHTYINKYKDRLSSANTQLTQLNELAVQGYDIGNYVVSLEHDANKLKEEISYNEKFMAMLEKTYCGNFLYLINNVSMLLDEINKGIIFDDIDFNVDDEEDDKVSVLTDTTVTSCYITNPLDVATDIVNKIIDDIVATNN